MSDIGAVKTEILSLLKADETLQGLLGKDPRGNYPVYHSLVQHEIHKPSITVEDIVGQAETSGLNDAFDGVKRYQWRHSVIQVDCWSSKHAEERDRLAVAVRKCLLRNLVDQALYIQEPSITVLDETDVKPPLWRASLRFKVMYVLEA